MGVVQISVTERAAFGFEAIGIQDETEAESYKGTSEQAVSG